MKAMKVKLLKKLRRRGYNSIEILSVTTGYKTGLSYSYSGDEYSGLYSFGDTPEDVKRKACRIYMEKEIKYRRKKRNK